MKIMRPLRISDDELAATNVIEPDTLPEAYNPGTSYSTGNTALYQNAIWEAQTAVQGVDPMTGNSRKPRLWLRVRSINPHAMFDGVIGDASQSSDVWPVHDGNGIQVEILPPGVVNTVVFFGLKGASVRIEVIDELEGVVYDTTKSLISTTGIDNWWSYFFEPITQESDILIDDVFDDLPQYRARLRISIQALEGESAACGLCLMGSQRELGKLKHATDVSVLDFSTRERDQWGRVDLRRGDGAKVGNFKVIMKASQSDATYAILERYRSTAMVFIGTSLFRSSIIYGYYEDMRISYDNVAHHSATIDVVGLT